MHCLQGFSRVAVVQQVDLLHRHPAGDLAQAFVERPAEGHSLAVAVGLRILPFWYRTAVVAVVVAVVAAVDRSRLAGAGSCQEALRLEAGCD